jgi:hypothetical protein
MKLYLAARYDRLAEMADLAIRIRGLGHEVTSRWIEGHGHPDADSARYDLTDVTVADGLVLFTEEPSAQMPFATRGGRHVEYGYALRAGKQMFIVGPRENIFHQLPDVEVLPDANALLARLARLKDEEIWS